MMPLDNVFPESVNLLILIMFCKDHDLPVINRLDCMNDRSIVSLTLDMLQHVRKV